MDLLSLPWEAIADVYTATVTLIGIVVGSFIQQRAYIDRKQTDQEEACKVIDTLLDETRAMLHQRTAATPATSTGARGGAASCGRGASPRVRSTRRTCWRRRGTSNSTRSAHGWSGGRGTGAGPVPGRTWRERTTGSFGSSRSWPCGRTGGRSCAKDWPRPRRTPCAGASAPAGR